VGGGYTSDSSCNHWRFDIRLETSIQTIIVKVYIRNVNHCYKIMMVSGRSALFCIMVVATLVITSDPSMFYLSVHILKLEGSENAVKN
jgi:hypothetical protein